MTNEYKKTPLVSVIIPAYNEEKYIAETIQSILGQSFTEFEVIIVDDGSTDKTYKIASSFTDSRLQVYQQENGGPAKARNEALVKARGSYIALQDADDRSMPDRLEKQYDFLNKNLDCIGVGTNAAYIKADGEFIFNTDNLPHNPENWSWNQPPCIHPSVMFRKSVLNNIGGYPDLPVSQDAFFLYKMSKHGQFRNIQESLYEYRVTPTSISRKNDNIKNLVQEIFKKFKDTGELDEAKVKELRGLKTKQTTKEKLYLYHLLLAKKYLWNNYQPSKSRENIYSIFKLKKIPYSLQPYMLYLLSFMDENTVRYLHRKLKTDER